MSYERAIAELEAIIDRIESGEIGLEESVRAYERGVALQAHCKAILARAEQRVTELGTGGTGGTGGGGATGGTGAGAER